jgi:formyltetrahydrofolate-dependent phosphoribosylglycinamide formyltransferase
MLNIAVFVSGNGSNLKSIFQSTSKEKVRICAVVSDKKDCGGIQFALVNHIPVFLVRAKQESNFFSYEQIVEEFKKIPIDLIVLAGFLKKIPDCLVDAFENKIVNIHPALLPSFGGKGMYGINVHRAVYESSVKVSGVSIHFVDKIYDHGRIIAQRSVDISKLNSAEEIAEHVLRIEHELLPFVVEKFADNKIVIKNNRVEIAD